MCFWVFCACSCGLILQARQTSETVQGSEKVLGPSVWKVKTFKLNTTNLQKLRYAHACTQLTDTATCLVLISQVAHLSVPEAPAAVMTTIVKPTGKKSSASCTFFRECLQPSSLKRCSWATAVLTEDEVVGRWNWDTVEPPQEKVFKAGDRSACCGPVVTDEWRGHWLTQTRRDKLRLALVRHLPVTCATSEVWRQNNSLLYANTTICIFMACISKSYFIKCLAHFSFQGKFQFWDHVTHPHIHPLNTHTHPPLITTKPILSIGGSGITFS